MAAGPAFPSYAYNSAGQPAVIVGTQAAFNALSGAGTWAFTPFATALVTAPVDTTPVLTATDIRLQQLLAEARVTNLLLQEGFLIKDSTDSTGLRTDITAQDIGLTT